MEAFVGKVMGDTSAAMTTMMLCTLGDRLGLFKDLAENGTTTAADFAGRTGTNPRYAREWLGGMAATGYIDYDPASESFTMPEEHAPALAHEGGPVFFGGVFEMLPPLAGVLDRVEDSFKKGGGVHQSEYDPRWWDGLERFTRGWFDNLLIQEWMPSVPEVKEKLESGAMMADVGCGRGRALILLAEAYPKSTFVGYDAFGPTIEAATEKAKTAGVSDRVRFEECDGASGLPDKYDVVATFDVVHDAADPLGLMTGIRQSLNEGGHYLCLDINCAEKLEDNVGPLGAMFHGFSIGYCMTTSLANDGAGLGPLGLHVPKLRQLTTEAGFSSVETVYETPFNRLYHLKP